MEGLQNDSQAQTVQIGETPNHLLTLRGMQSESNRRHQRARERERDRERQRERDERKRREPRECAAVEWSGRSEE